MAARRLSALCFLGLLVGSVFAGGVQQEARLGRRLVAASDKSNGNGQAASESDNGGGNGENGPPPNNGQGNIKDGEPGNEKRAVHFTLSSDLEFKKNTKNVPSNQACYGTCNGCTSGSCPINYNNYNTNSQTGQPIMTGSNSIYYIFYGAWNLTSTRLKEQILVNLGTGIGRSSHLSINNNYYQVTGGTKQSLTVGGGNNNPTFGGKTYDPYQSYQAGTKLSQSNLRTIVTNALSSGALPTSSNAVYFVLTSSDVAVGDTSGSFCSQFCGYHTKFTYNNLKIKWATVGDASTQCPGACISSIVQSNPPNGDAGADGMASVVCHELEETLSDPLSMSWFDAAGSENADKCAWRYGDVNGNYNVDLSQMVPPSGTAYTGRYLIQQNFNPSTGTCVMS